MRGVEIKGATPAGVRAGFNNEGGRVMNKMEQAKHCPATVKRGKFNSQCKRKRSNEAHDPYCWQHRVLGHKGWLFGPNRQTEESNGRRY